MILDYKALLCQLIDDLGGEVTFNKERLNREHHVLHWSEDKKELVIVSERLDEA